MLWVTREASQEQIHGHNRGAGTNAANGIHIGLFAVKVFDDVFFCICVDCNEACGIAVKRFVPSKVLSPRTRGVCRNYRSTAASFDQRHLRNAAHRLHRCGRPDYIFFSQRFARTQIREVPYFHRRITMYSAPPDSR